MNNSNTLGRYIPIVGGFVFGLLYFFSNYYIPLSIISVISLILFNIVFCIYANKKNIDFKIGNYFSYILLSMILLPIISGIVYFAAMSIFSKPECTNECINLFSYNIGGFFAPFISLLGYIPIIIHLLMIGLKLQKYVTYIFAIIFIILSVFCVIQII